MSPHLSQVARAPRLISAIAARPSVAAIIVSWRTGPLLLSCIDAALSAEDIDEVVLVDNGNPREMRTRLINAAAGRKDFRIIWGQGNVGFARGCNLGAAQATSERLLFLNPDAVIRSGDALEMALTGERQARPWIVGARVVSADGTEQRGARRGPLTMWSAFVEMAGLTRLSGLHDSFRTVHYEKDPLPEGPAPVAAVSGACMMMRADDFRAMDGFDERYFVHVEDVDICRRAREAGGDVVFTPHANVMHEGATSPVSSWRTGWYKGIGFAKYFAKFARCALSRSVALAMGPLVIAAALCHGTLRSAAYRIKQRKTHA